MVLKKKKAFTKCQSLRVNNIVMTMHSDRCLLDLLWRSLCKVYKCWGIKMPVHVLLDPSAEEITQSREGMKLD